MSNGASVNGYKGVVLIDTNGDPYIASGGGGGGGGDASAANQVTGNGYLSTIATFTASASTAANQTTGNGYLATLATNSPTLVSGRLPVDGSGVTQPVSGTVTANIGTVGTLATAANQTTSAGYLSTLATNSPTLVSGRLPVDGSAVTQPVSVASLPLPSGGSTATNQTTGNTSLATIATNTTGLATSSGQTTAAGYLSTLATFTSSASTAANQTTANSSLSTIATEIGGLTETAPATDTASGGLNARLQRVCQRLTSLFTAMSDGSQLTKITNGTQTADTIAGDSGQNALVAAFTKKEVSFNVSGAGLSTAIDVSNYGSVAIHVVTNSGAVTPQVSNDNANWVGLACTQSNSTGNSPPILLTAATNVALNANIPARYFRLSTSASAAGVIVLKTTSINPMVLTASCLQSTTPWSTAGVGAHAATISGNPFRLGGRALTANYTAVTTGQTADLVTTLVGSLVTKPFSIPEGDWSFAVATGGISNTTTAVTIAAAAGAGLRNYITGIQISADALGAATELVIRDGAGGTVIWRTKIMTAGLAAMSVRFDSPLRSTANTLLEIATLTATVTGGVYPNTQGYIAP